MPAITTVHQIHDQRKQFLITDAQAQGIIVFSYVCNGKKIKELFASALNGIAACVRCVSTNIKRQ